MFYRKEDDDHAAEARSLLQLEAWPGSCAALATLPNLRRLRIYVGNPQYLDKQYLMGQQQDVHKAILEFVKEIRVAIKGLEVYVAEKRLNGSGRDGHWRTRGVCAKVSRKLDCELQDQGINCQWL
jgi:hypothetical protein